MCCAHAISKAALALYLYTYIIVVTTIHLKEVYCLRCIVAVAFYISASNILFYPSKRTHVDNTLPLLTTHTDGTEARQLQISALLLN